MSRGLTAAQVRVLGSLIEKERTTPDQYPLTTNALVAACNQRNNRDPIVAYDDRLVDATVLSLREDGLARTVRPSGNRVHKHRHVLDEAWGLDGSQLAVLAVLMLRGPQTVGELRARTERYDAADGPIDAAATLESLAALADPLAVDIGRAPGQSQDRWMHLAGDVSDAADEPPASARSPDVPPDVPPAMAHPAPAVASPAPPAAPDHAAGDLAALDARVQRLEERLARLESELGWSDDR